MRFIFYCFKLVSKEKWELVIVCLARSFGNRIRPEFFLLITVSDWYEVYVRKAEAQSFNVFIVNEILEKRWALFEHAYKCLRFFYLSGSLNLIIFWI